MRPTSVRLRVLAMIAQRQAQAHAFKDARATAGMITKAIDALDVEARPEFREIAARLRIDAGDLAAAAEIHAAGARASVLARAAALHAGRSPAATVERFIAAAEEATIR